MLSTTRPCVVKIKGVGSLFSTFMTVTTYNEQHLIAGLDRLPQSLRVVFATSCAERLFPSYVAFWEKTDRGDPKRLRGCLDRLWRDLECNDIREEEIQECIALCMKLIPQEDDEPWVIEQVAAEDAAEAVAYALGCKQSGEAQQAAWAARCVYEALDHFVINSEGIDINEPGGEERVWSHPLVQAELLRQQRDLDELFTVAPSEEPASDLVTNFRNRAKAESAILLKLRGN